MNNFKKINSPFHPSWLKGAGDINLTAADLFKLMQALDKETLLKSESINKLSFNYAINWCK